MNKSFYSLGIFFFALLAAGALCQGIAFLALEFDIYNLRVFANWTLVMACVGLISEIFVLRYYHYKAHKLAFAAGMLATAVAFLQAIFYYLLMEPVLREWQSYYLTLAMLATGLLMVYALALIFSSSGRNQWLRTLGIFLLMMGSVAIYVGVQNLKNGNLLPDGTTTLLIKGLLLARFIPSLLLIALFAMERKALNTRDAPAALPKSLDLMYGVAGITAFLLLAATASASVQIYERTHVPAHIKKLAEPFEARRFGNGRGDTLLYQLLVPLNYDAAQQYPLVVCLHGGAGWGTDNFRQFQGSPFARMLSTPLNRQQYPAFVFVPQCPPGSSWGSGPTGPITRLPAIDVLVFEAIDSLLQEFPIDRSRLYVTGHSLGGYGAWHFIGAQPERFAAAVPMAGEGDPSLAPRMVDVAVWAFHGANDYNVPVSGSRNMIEAIKRAGGNPRYTESPSGGHDWDIMQNTPGVLEWLFAQGREATAESTSALPAPQTPN